LSPFNKNKDFIKNFYFLKNHVDKLPHTLEEKKSVKPIFKSPALFGQADSDGGCAILLPN